MNKLLDRLSDFVDKYPGLIPIIGLVLVVINLILQLFRGNWIVDSNLLLHIGVITSLIGILLIRPFR
jgi:hypothetical protein